MRIKSRNDRAVEVHYLSDRRTGRKTTTSQGGGRSRRRSGIRQKRRRISSRPETRPSMSGFGSMVGFDREFVMREVLNALDGRRALLFSGWNEFGSLSLPSNVLPIGPAPHDQLFPLVSDGHPPRRSRYIPVGGRGRGAFGGGSVHGGSALLGLTVAAGRSGATERALQAPQFRLAAQTDHGSVVSGSASPRRSSRAANAR